MGIYLSQPTQRGKKREKREGNHKKGDERKGEPYMPIMDGIVALKKLNL